MKAYPPNPSGFCLCGCGQPTAVMDQNDRSQGLVKGQPRSFVHGHHRRKKVDLSGGPNPDGFCFCGCKGKVAIASSTSEGVVKGQYRRFVRGHSRKGKVDLQAKKRSRDRYRTRKLGQFVEDVDRNVVFETHRGMCGICAKPVVGRFHIDHVIPLSKGGLHCYANVQPAHPNCNLKKWAKDQDAVVL